MPFYGTGVGGSDDLLDSEFDYDAYTEACVYDILSHTPESTRKEILSESSVLLEATKGLIGRRTFIRLDKNDDASRRTKIAAYQIAKEKNDPDWQKLVKYQALKKKFARKIEKKYKSQAARVAKKAQREYLSKGPVKKLISKADLKATRDDGGTDGDKK